jgi:glyoxylase-like metal-dependent hydrolase (beta-lactamase superfamily II)
MVMSRAAEVGIRRLVVPTPFSLGAVNAYLIEDDPLTLIDAGPNSGSSLDALQRGLDALGHRVERIGLIVVTHQHMDHLGLVDLLAQRSGAEVAALDALAPWSADWPASMEAEDAYADEVMARYGVPADLRSVLRAVTATYRGWGASMRVTMPLADGASLALRDHHFVIHHVPGHSPSDIVLHEQHSGALLAADHLLCDVDSNALVSRPLTGEADIGRQPSPLLTYGASFRRTRELDVRFVLPGHGAPFEDHRAQIDNRFATWQRRADRLHAALAPAPRTAFELTQCVWGNVAVRRAYHLLSSVLGQLGLLVAEGSVREVVRTDGVVAFTAVAPTG